MKVLFDTSVLIAGLIVAHPQHSVCFPHLKAAQAGETDGYISTHSMAETYSVITRMPIKPRISPEQAQHIMDDLISYLGVMPLLKDDYHAAIAQMVNLKIPGGGIFDALIAQAALKANVDILFTLNPKHFTRLGGEISNLVQVPSGTNPRYL